jgi:ADP-ribosylglycohydrolase
MPATYSYEHEDLDPISSPRQAGVDMSPVEPTVSRGARARGCFLGGALGDALGAPVEFWRLDRILAECGPDGVTTMLPAYGRDGGAITDDTQMTLFAIEGLLAADGAELRAESVHAAFLDWYRTQTKAFPGAVGSTGVVSAADGLLGEEWLWSMRAPGNTCLSSLANGRVGKNAVNDSKGCGTVMRSAPFGFTSSPVDLAATSSFHTHGHATAAVSAAYLANVVALLVDNHSLAEAVATTRDVIVDHFPGHHHETTRIVDRAVALADDGPPNPQTVESLGGGWIAEEALAISILVALTATDWSDALTRAVTHSGDTDSTGAITGNLLGALRGDQDLPADWLTQLEGKPTITRLANQLASTSL